MGLRIRTNVASLGAQRSLEDTTFRVTQSMEKLASGYRINRAADDAAGLAVSETMTAQMRSMLQAKRNAADGVSMLQVAEGSMHEMSNILIRLRELAVQAATDTLSNRERAFANREYQELLDEIDRIGQTTAFNGLKLLRLDPDEPLEVHAGVGDGTYPNTDRIRLPFEGLERLTAEGLGLDDDEAIGPQHGHDEDFTGRQAASQLALLDEALTDVNGFRAQLGAVSNRLGSTLSTLSIAAENMSAAKSRIKDVDMASETAIFAQNRILQQGGASILAQANSLPEVALALLR